MATTSAERLRVRALLADIGPESMVRLIVSEIHERQISCVRITEYWPVRPLIGQELSPATIVVVL